MQTRSQRDAEVIYRQVRETTDLDDKAKVRYGGWCHRFPVLVLRAGLAEAAAFLEAKAKAKAKANGDGRAAEGDRRFLGHMGATLGCEGRLALTARGADLADYRRLTRRTLEAAVWYKRYAESVLGLSAADADREGDDA